MKWVASLAGVGFLPGAPGTWGALVALPLAYGIHQVGGFFLLLNITVFAFISGLIAVQKLTAQGEAHDPGWIVIDELVGQWIALFPVSYGAAMMGVEVWRLWPGWVAGFILFRLFDIWKPWIVGRVDRMGTPSSVMLDDVLAGILAALCTVALGALYHGIFM